MGDLITLNCPSCGGKLEVNSNTLVLSCQHCGSEHMVHRESGVVTLESFARCPKCGRNDRVEKVSAIHNYKSGSHLLISKLAPPSLNDYEILRIRPIPHLNLPEKPELREVPEKPQQEKYKLVIYFFVIIFMVVMGVIILTPQFSEYRGAAIFAFLIVVWIIVGFLKLPSNIKKILWIRKFRKNYDKFVDDLNYENKLAVKNWHEECEKLTDLYKKEKELIRKENERRSAINRKNQLRYKHSTKRWKKLYYCHRDDSVFVPGEGTYASVDRIEEYLSQNSKE